MDAWSIDKQVETASEFNSERNGAGRERSARLATQNKPLMNGFIFFANNKGFRDSSREPIFRSLQFDHNGSASQAKCYSFIADFREVGDQLDGG